MTERKNGFYWVRMAEGDASQTAWLVAEWAKDRWLIAGCFGETLTDAEMTVIGSRIPSPNEAPRSVTPEMLEVGALAFRNSSWHELTPTDIDRQVSEETFGEVFEAMLAVQPGRAVAALCDTPEADWDLETEAFNLANTSGLPDEVYRHAIKRLWEAYCAEEARADSYLAELRLWLTMVDEGGVPRFTIQPGAGLNIMVEGTRNLTRFTERTGARYVPPYPVGDNRALRETPAWLVGVIARLMHSKDADAGDKTTRNDTETLDSMIEWARIIAKMPFLTSIGFEVFEAADKARGDYLREVDVNDHVSAENIAISTAVHMLARRQLPVHDGVEAYPLNAFIWKRESTGEWVLDLSGSINDSGFFIRHTQPGDLAPEDAVGLPTHYDLLRAAETVMESNDPHRDTLHDALTAMGVQVERNQPAPVIIPNENA